MMTTKNRRHGVRSKDQGLRTSEKILYLAKSVSRSQEVCASAGHVGSFLSLAIVLKGYRFTVLPPERTFSGPAHNI